MAENTKIEWCDSTFNPWTGCTKVGPGCDNCYAEGWAKRSGIVQWGPGAERRRTSAANWRKPLQWNAKPFFECVACGWRGERFLVHFDGDQCPHCCTVGDIKPARRRVFCASLADVFDNEVPVEWRADLFDLIQATPNLDWLLVTKRIGNAGRMLADGIPANVWLGITVVNQAEADRDIPKLLSTPAALITALIGHWIDAGVLFCAVLINALIGFIQEGKAQNALMAIRTLLAPLAQVLRDGQRHDVDAGQLVPGDVVTLVSGDRVPADLRLLWVKELRIDEATLTGESLPVEKTLEPATLHAPLGDRFGMAYSGTLVVQGQASGMVVATGMRTELGKISGLLSGIQTLSTPLIRQIDQVGHRLAVVIP